MQLTSPVIITSRLRPGVQIGPATISIEYAGCRDGRTVYRYFIDLPDYEYESTDLASGCQGGDLQEGLASLLSFLGAFAESVSHATFAADRQPGENADLFPVELADWACQYSDEIDLLSIELEETADLIEE